MGSWICVHESYVDYSYVHWLYISSSTGIEAFFLNGQTKGIHEAHTRSTTLAVNTLKWTKRDVSTCKRSLDIRGSFAQSCALSEVNWEVGGCTYNLLLICWRTKSTPPLITHRHTHANTVNVYTTTVHYT